MNSSVPPPSTSSSLKVKGRMMLHEDFTERFGSLCSSLGFDDAKILQPDSFINHHRADSQGSPVPSPADAVVLLSCRVAYNPNWGGHCGLPQRRVRYTGDRPDHCPAAFIAPFLQQYRFAQEHIHLTRTCQGDHLITMPAILAEPNGEKQGSRLHIELDKVAAPDQDGGFTPLVTAGEMVSYPLAHEFQRTLDTLNFAWRPAGSIPIGPYLGSEMFSFTDIEQSADPDSPFWPTLLPHLRRIVTHRTPHLHAAEIHLSQQFSRAVTACLAASRRAGSGNMLCLAGLDIDMSSLHGHEEHYFVPWRAYLKTSNDNQEMKCALEQDDLYVRLMQQN